MRGKYTDSTHLIVAVIDDDGVSRSSVMAWTLPQETIIDPADPPPPPTQDQLDTAAAKVYAPLVALMTMSPAQVQQYVQNNVTNLAQARDAITTLAVAVSVLARRICALMLINRWVPNGDVVGGH